MMQCEIQVSGVEKCSSLVTTSSSNPLQIAGQTTSNPTCKSQWKPICTKPVLHQNFVFCHIAIDFSRLILFICNPPPTLFISGVGTGTAIIFGSCDEEVSGCA